MMETSDHATIGAVITLALGVVKAAEAFINWLIKKSRGKEAAARALTVDLSTEPARMLRETYERANRIDDVMSLKDRDGIPMVYTPRSFIDTQSRVAEAIRDLGTGQVQLDKKQSDALETLRKFDEDYSKKLDEILSHIKKQ